MPTLLEGSGLEEAVPTLLLGREPKSILEEAVTTLLEESGLEQGVATRPIMLHS